MQKNLQTKNLKIFEGLRNYDEDNAVSLNQLYNARNARFRGFVISSRFGWQPIGQSGNDRVYGLYDYQFTDAGVPQEDLIKFEDKTFFVYDINTDDFSPITTVWPDVADSFTDGTNYNNYLYVVNPLTAQNDGVGKISNDLYSHAYLTGGTGAESNPATYSSVTDGSVGITIDGVSVNLTGLSFAGVVTMDDVAGIIESALRAATGGLQSVAWDTDHFVITSWLDSAQSSVSFCYTVTSGTVGTDISGAGGSDWMDCDAVGGGVITPAASLGTSFVTIANSPRGIAIESWVERLWVIGDEAAPNAVYASKAALAAFPQNVEIWDTTNGAFIELIGKGGKCVAMRVLNNEFYIFKTDSIWYNTPDRIAAGDTQFIELSRTGGAMNQKSTIVVENDIWFLTPNLEIRSLGSERNFFNNPRTRDLSNVIKKTMNLLERDQSNAVMSYTDRVVKLSLRSRGSSTNNVSIIFDYDTGNFSFEVGQSINLATIWQNRRIYSEDGNSSQIYQDDIGLTAGSGQFSFAVDTPFMDDNRPDTFKRARYIYVRGFQTYDQPLTVRLYRGNYDTYSDYKIKSPRERGVPQEGDGGSTWGSGQFGSSLWGGGSADESTPYYRFGTLISVQRRSNMFALGFLAVVNGGRVIIDQAVVKYIPENENYLRVTI